MKLLVATDAHILLTPDGKHWCSSIYDYSFWKRYLDVFEDVKIVARMKKVDQISSGLLVDGPHVEVFGIPFFQGPKQLAQNFFSIWKRLKYADADCDAALLRIPGTTAELTSFRLRRGIPLGCEVVCDVTTAKTGDRLLDCINRVTEWDLRRLCQKANGVAYVTHDQIQAHFPSRARLKGESQRFFEASFSTINLPDEAFSGERTYTNHTGLTAVLTSVAMESERKGEQRLIKAVWLARQKGYDVRAILVGDGSRRPLFEEYARELQITDHVRFTGLLPNPQQVRDILKKADIYVLPSRAEGLPRGIIEAMALGMPILATPVGGTPELLEEKYMFAPDDVEAFANMFCYLLDHKEELDEMSKKNFKKAQEYKNSILQCRRNQFYSMLKNLAE